MQISSHSRKPSSRIKQTQPKFITSPPCVPIGYTRQEVCPLHSLEITDLKTNIISHICSPTYIIIVSIPKPNKDIYKGTSYRPISLHSVIAKTLEKSLLPYITGNIPNTPTQHGYKTQHSTVTALHTVNNTVAKGINQMAPLCEQSL